MITSSRMSWVLLLGALVSCRCERPPAPAPAAAPAPHSQAWLEGRLEPEPPGRTPARGGRLVIRVGREPEGLCQLHDQMRDPELARYTVGPVYETLLETEPGEGELRPLLAETWTSSPEGRVHIFRLREGIRFHDGTPLTAADVAATLRAVRSPMNFTTAMREALDGLSAVEVLDARTVLVRWDRASFEGFRTLALALPILPAGSLAQGFNTAAILRRPIGTGPFVFGEWEAGGSLTLKRNEDYWREGAHLDEVILRFVPDPALAAKAFEEGGFDLMTGISPEQWRQMESAEWARGWQRVRVVENAFSFLGWNLRRPQLADVRVRRALSLLHPVEEVAAIVDLGLAPPTDCPFFRHARACDSAREPPAPGEAIALLEEAGWRDLDGDGIRERDGLPLAITLLVTPESTGASRLASLLRGHWRKAGVALEVEQVAWSAYRERLAGHDFDAVALLWSRPDAESDLHPIFHSGAAVGLNYGGYASPEADGLLDGLRESFDSEARIDLGRRLHRQLRADQPYLFLSNRPRLEAARRGVHGLSSALRWHELRKLWIDPPPARPGAAGDPLREEPGLD